MTPRPGAWSTTSRRIALPTVDPARASPVGFMSACQSADERSDFVPGFASYDQLTVLDLVCREIQRCRSSIHDYRKSGDAGRSLEAPGPALDRLGFNTSAIQLFPNVTNELELAQIE
jgi:hypothetical protein